MRLQNKTKIKLANMFLLFAIVTFFLCFRIPVSTLLNLIIVKPLISGFENTIQTNIVLLAFLSALSLWLWTSTSNRFVSTVAIAAASFYLIQRWNPFWKYQNSALLPALYNWDIVVFAVLIPVLRLCQLRNSPPEINTLSNGFIEGLPVEKEEDDGFKRNSVAHKVAELILATRNTQAFAIGILGEYGSGKTSFINLILLNLPTDHVEVVKFYPGNVDNVDSISSDFFDLLANKLFYLSPQFSSLITNYARKLSKINTNSGKLAQQMHLLSQWGKNDKGERDQINDLLLTVDKKIIVVIDDIDRLYDDEIIEVFRIIRNTANFSNIIYLVAYEQEYVREAIKSINAKVADSYLDKIIQLEIPLPKREIEDLIRLMENHLQTFLTKEHQIELKKHIIPDGFKSKFDFSFSSIFRSSRDVIKFVNSFHVSYELLHLETLFYNLFVLELLKFRFQDVYHLVYDRQSEWLYLKPSRSSYQEYYELKTYKIDGVERLNIEKTLDSKYSSNDVKLISSLLRNLFSTYNRNVKTKNAIIHPMFFARYFRFRIANNELSEREFMMCWNGDLPTIKQFIDVMHDRGLIKEVLTRLFQVTPSSRDEFERQIESVFHLGPAYVKQYGNTSFDTSALIDKLWNYENNISNKFYKADTNAHASFLKRLFKNAQPPYLFENDLIYDIKRTSREIAISKDTLIAQQCQYFANHVEHLGITADAIWLFFGIRQTYIETTSNGTQLDKWRFEPIIVPVVKKLLLENDPVHFLHSSIEFNRRDEELVRIIPQILELFDAPQDFKILIQNHELIDNSIRNEFLMFFDECEKVGFDKLIEFEFSPALARVKDNTED